MRELTRRDALSGVAALGAVTLAGCVNEEEENGEGNGANGTAAGNGDSNGDDGNGDGGNGGEATAATILESSSETIGADERSDEYDWATIERQEQTVLIHGVIPASTPCHRAVVESTVEDGELSVAVSLESTLDDDEACTQVLAEIEYEASIELDGDVQRVEVAHEGGETHVED